MNNDLPEIVDRVRAGDQEALAQLIIRFQDRLLPRIRSLISPDLRALTESQGVMDSVFLRAPDLLQGFEYRDEESLLNYLAKVAAFKISDRRDYLAAAKRGGGKRLAGGTVAEDLLAAMAAGDPTVSEELARTEEGSRLHATLAQLKPEHREAVVLRYFDGLSLREIGCRVGISEDAARMRVARAENALAKAYDDMGWNHA